VEVPTVDGNQPRDHDNDGLFEDITDTGTITTLDVQTLFQRLDDPAVQENAWAYKFSRDGSDRVNIFDVQALYLQMWA
jgi:hypothetical protein